MTNISRLVSRARNGDQRSIRSLYDTHVEDVWRLSFRILQNRALAQDCSQEVFIKALNSLENLDDPARFGAWLYRITYRKAIDMLRTERRHKADELMRTLP